MPKTQTTPKTESFRKVSVGELRVQLPPSLRRDPLGAHIWMEVGKLEVDEALELEGRGPDARRIGRAVAKYGRAEGKEFRVFSAGGHCYIVRVK